MYNIFMNISYAIPSINNLVLDPQFHKGHNFRVIDSTKHKKIKKYIWQAKRQNSDFLFIAKAKNHFQVFVKYKKIYKLLTIDNLVFLISKFAGIQFDILRKSTSGDLVSVLPIKSLNETWNLKQDFLKNQSSDVIAYSQEKIYLKKDQKILSNLDLQKFIFAIFEKIYRSQSNPYSEITKAWEKYGVRKQITFVKTFKNQSFANLVKAISKTKKIGNKKIINIFKERSNLVKLFFEDGSWIVLNKSYQKIKGSIFIVGQKNQSLTDVIFFEKVIQNFVDEHIADEIKNPRIWKDILKFSICALIIAGIFVYVFSSIYAKSFSQTWMVWANAIYLFNRPKHIVWLSYWIFQFLNFAIYAILVKRIGTFQKEQIKIKHAFIVVFLSRFIALLTPLGMGGDVFSYWYLRKKGFKHSTLISLFMSKAILWQLGFLLQTLVLLGPGLSVYQEIFFHHDHKSQVVFVWFLLGTAWSSFVVISLLFISMNKWFQEFIIKKIIWFIEWSHFIYIAEPEVYLAKFNYELRETRQGIKVIFFKWRQIIELLFYTILGRLFLAVPLVLIMAQVVRGNFIPSQYFKQLVLMDIVNTSNSVSLTPGGSGTLEWLKINVNQIIYLGDILPYHILNNKSQDTAASVDVVLKLIYNWPVMFYSLALIFTLYIGEKRLAKYRSIRKNKKLQGQIYARQTSFFFKMSVVWFVLLLTLPILILAF